MDKSAKRAARLAVLSALGVVFLFLGSVIPAGRIALAVIASFGVCGALMMYGFGWAFGVFCLTALLGWLVFPGTGVVLYTAFFGYYPIVKSLFERIHSRVLEWVCKYALYTAVFALYCFVAQSLLAFDGKALAWYVLYPLGAAVFFLYDRCFTLLIGYYIDKIARYFP